MSHKIDVNGAEPIKKRHYSVSPAIQKIMYDEVNKLISLGIIEESKIAWSSTIVSVQEYNGKVRLFLDSKVLNSVTVKMNSLYAESRRNIKHRPERHILVR